MTKADIKRIAEASLSRVAIIKNPNGKVLVREIDYIPDWQYLQKKGFDISDIPYGFQNDFTGRLIIKKWKGESV